jgi:D-sedoheptulose 7-phosphate isomerase
LQEARRKGAMTFALYGEPPPNDPVHDESIHDVDHSFAPPSDDPFVCQEIAEVLYHVLWETVHVYFEHREQGHDVGASSFLYPFLGQTEQGLETEATAEVQASMVQKAADLNDIRTKMAEREVETISVVASQVLARLNAGGKLIAFGNGGSATDANDLVWDCLAPPPGLTPFPAISLAAEPANITAVANDIGSDAIFARQLIAHAHPEDIAIGISTSGSSPNILAALAEARRRGLMTVAFAGYHGGKVAHDRLADYTVVTRSDYIPRIQEAQASAYHVLLRRIEDARRGA